MITTNRVALSPWARAALPTEAQERLEEEAAAVNCYVSTVKRGDGRWMARAFSRHSEIRAQFIGHDIVRSIEGAIERFRDQFYTPEELVQIQRQSV